MIVMNDKRKFRTEEEMLEFYELKAKDLGDNSYFNDFDEEEKQNNTDREKKEEGGLLGNHLRSSAQKRPQLKYKDALNDSRSNDFEGFEDLF